MKNLLKLLSILAISTPIPLTVVACGNKKPAPDTRIDISNKITSSIDLGQLDTNTASDFLAKLQTQLVTISGLSTITTSDYDVYKAGTATAIQDSDITANTSLNIKIVAKGENFKGIKENIKTNYTQKDTRIDLKTITQLNGLEITANLSKTYKELITNINNFNEFKLKPLTDGYQLQFYDEKNKEITNDKQELEKISKISIKIISSLNDKSYQGSTIIDITKKTNISDIDMQNYFKKKTLPLAEFTPENPSTPSTVNKQEAVENVISSLKKIQKKYETATKLILEGMYKEKIDFNKLTNKNEIYDINKNPVPDNWFENKEEKKEAKIIIYYGSVKEEEGYFFPIWINII